MADDDSGSRRLDDYLGRLRSELRGLPDFQAAEIVEELRSHVRDSAGGGLAEAGVAAALERLGPPAELAAMYVAEDVFARAKASRSPWLILRSISRWARASLAGLLVLGASLVGYVLAASLVLAALAKPFAPDRAGLWRLQESSDSFSLRLGFGSPPPGHELLGWWIVPLGLLAGAGLFWLTTRLGLWCIHRFRRPSQATAP